MGLLEKIIRAPIFFQIIIFVLQFSILLFEIEMVSFCIEHVLMYFMWKFPFKTKTSIIFQNVTHFSFNLIAFFTGLIFLCIMNYMLCYFITTLTSNVASISDRIYDLNWYQLPQNEQIVIQVIIRRAQIPFELKGLGVFVCSLETYLRVKKWAYCNGICQ